LATSGKECGERLHLFIRQRPGTEDDVGEMARICASRGSVLASFPVALAKSAPVEDGDHDRQPRRDERPAEWQLETTGRFQDDQRNRESRRRSTTWASRAHHWYDETSFGSQGNIQLSLRDIDYQQTMGPGGHVSPGAHPCMMRACGPVQLFGLIQDKGVTTLATPRSQTTSAGSVYHARWREIPSSETRDSRYKAEGTVFPLFGVSARWMVLAPRSSIFAAPADTIKLFIRPPFIPRFTIVEVCFSLC